MICISWGVWEDNTYICPAVLTNFLDNITPRMENTLYRKPCIPLNSARIRRPSLIIEHSQLRDYRRFRSLIFVGCPDFRHQAARLLFFFFFFSFFSFFGFFCACTFQIGASPKCKIGISRKDLGSGTAAVGQFRGLIILCFSSGTDCGFWFRTKGLIPTVAA